MEDRPSGPDTEHRQPSKTINAKAQQRMRAERRRKRIADRYDEAVLNSTTIAEILRRNSIVEEKIKSRTDSKTLSAATVTIFLLLSAKELRDFLHAR